LHCIVARSSQHTSHCKVVVVGVSSTPCNVDSNPLFAACRIARHTTSPPLERVCIPPPSTTTKPACSSLLGPAHLPAPCVREEKKYRGSRLVSCVRGRSNVCGRLHVDQLIQPCTATCIPCTKYLHCAEVEQLLHDHTASLARSQHVKSHQRR
jgi:hypothetical protein